MGNNLHLKFLASQPCKLDSLLVSFGVATTNFSKSLLKREWLFLFHRLFPFSNLALLDDRLNRIFNLHTYVNPTELATADHITTSDLKKINIRIDNAIRESRKV